MDRFLALSIADRARAFESAADDQGMSAVSIEKDFWVWLMLREVLAIPGYSDHLTFKGGTSLSKAWGLIDRFSEDIDLTMHRDALGFSGDRDPERATGNERKRRLKALRAACQSAVCTTIASHLSAQLSALLPTGGWDLTVDPDDPDQQTLLFAYPRPSGTVTEYLSPVVKLEFGARGDPWPAEPRQIRPLIFKSFPDLLSVSEIEVPALRPERTFWEKALLLHEERTRRIERPVRRAMSRHYYDLARLVESGVAAKAVSDTSLFAQVIHHRAVYFNQSWVNYDELTPERIVVVPANRDIAEWRDDYIAMQPEMFAEPPPPFDDVLRVIDRFFANLGAS